jgi:hypothetical protein
MKFIMYIFGRVQEGGLFVTKYLNKCWTLHIYSSCKTSKRKHQLKDIDGDGRTRLKQILK